jgi:uncharacterized protein YaaQ
MKMIVAIVQDNTANAVAKCLVDNDYRSTKLASTGSFLKKGNTTFIIGVEDEEVEKVIDLIRGQASTHHEFIVPTGATVQADLSLTSLMAPVEIEVSGATVFVLPVDQFLQL